MMELLLFQVVSAVLYRRLLLMAKISVLTILLHGLNLFFLIGSILKYNLGRIQNRRKSTPGLKRFPRFTIFLLLARLIVITLIVRIEGLKTYFWQLDSQVASPETSKLKQEKRA